MIYNNPTVAERLLVILAMALDPEGKALAPLKQAYDLGYADGVASVDESQPKAEVSH